MRGEHLPRFTHLILDEGSSPHARGALGDVVAALHGHGIIPACAGSTGASTPGHTSARDHPRMRGEHGTCTSAADEWGGSSPHARGALPRTGLVHDVAGIIPACAGSTPGTARRPGLARDHPRMRGEHGESSSTLKFAQGSSPHARGAHLNTCGFAQDSSESH